MKARPWSDAEVSHLSSLVKEGTPYPTIYEAFPYRTADSIRHKMRAIKSTLTQNEAEEKVLQSILDKWKEIGPVHTRIPEKEVSPKTGSPLPLQERELEICLMDPHFGMTTYRSESDHPWSMDMAEETIYWALDSLIELAAPFGPFSRVVMPFGNDFLHADNIFHTTTKGTGQPEMDSWHEVYRRGKELAIGMVERVKQVAPVKIYQIPGNHCLHSDYTIGLLLDAYYSRDSQVEVDCSASPYKYHRFGCNLIGYEHGHSVAPIRLAALMANERPKDWAETKFREYHLGDQHRKGSSLPSALEEQGVSVEYIPGLTPPNFWHRTHSFNYQKRGAMAFVWDRDRGQQARLQVNLDQYTGKPMGVTPNVGKVS